MFSFKSFLASKAFVDANKTSRAQKQNLFDYENSGINIGLRAYWFLAFCRFLLTLIPQNGYVHPDEYFQSLEVLNGDIFGFLSNRPWEFNPHSPVRSASVVYLFMGVPLLVLKFFAIIIYSWIGFNIITPYSLLVAPRLFMCCFSFIADYCIYKICVRHQLNYSIRLFAFASSYVTLIYCTRTFSNSVELVLFSFLLHLVSESMAHSDKVLSKEEFLNDRISGAASMKERVKLVRLRSGLPRHTLHSVALISAVGVIGLFNRATFAVYAVGPVCLWLQRGLGRADMSVKDVHWRAAALTLTAAPLVLLLVLSDSIYFGAVPLPRLAALDVSPAELLITPYNFLRYNMNSTNLAFHGSHPRYTHLLVHVPLLFTVLGLHALHYLASTALRMVRREWGRLPRSGSLVLLLTTSVVMPLTLLSAAPHQEARFILPLLTPLVLLLGSKLFSSHRALSLWLLSNLLLTAYFGFLQQAGVFSLVKEVGKRLEDKPRLTSLHLVTSYCYPVPLSFLAIRHRVKVHPISGHRYQVGRDVFLEEMGSEGGVRGLVRRVVAVRESAERRRSEDRLRYTLLVALPTGLLATWHSSAHHRLPYQVERAWWPHVSVEALLAHDTTHHCSSDTRCGTSLMEMFGLTLLRIPMAPSLPSNSSSHLKPHSNSTRPP